MKRRKYREHLGMLPGVLLVLALIAIVVGNGFATKRATRQQAMEYLEQASDRSAEELEKTFLRQEENIQTMAHMTAHIMEYEFIDTERLIHLTENSSFDGIEYIHPGGGCYGMNEQSWSVEDKEYFQDAVQQHVGYAYDNVPERGEGNCLVFYAPILAEDGVFDGVLVGYFNGETLEKMLDVSFWGQRAKQFLCTADGTIVAANDPGESCSNLTEHLKKNSDMTESECEEVADLLQTGSGNFTYKVNGKVELGSVGTVDSGKFLLVETFPPGVLSDLTSPMLDKMHLALVCVFISLCAYALITYLIAAKSKKHLEEEKDKVSEQLKGAEHMASHDDLTGLLNRIGLAEAIESRHLTDAYGAFLIVDIDHFKEINDNYGHQIGDELLVKVSGSLKDTFREEDVLARIGGDEFVLLLPNLKPEQSGVIKRKIGRLNETLKNSEDGLPEVSVSVGATFARPGETDDLFVRADKALYETKARGRCGSCIYEELADRK